MNQEQKGEVKVNEVRGTFAEVYPAAAVVFESLPSRKLVEEALILGQFDGLQGWYYPYEAAALANESDPNSINEETLGMQIYEDQRMITMITPTSGRVIRIDFQKGILNTVINFGKEGSEVAAGYVIRHIKHFHPYPAAIYTLTNGDTYQVAFVKPAAADDIYFRRVNGPDENTMWEEIDNLPEKWPAVTEHRTMEECNRTLFWSREISDVESI
ncbi:hypothetical protein [Paenibacillus jiagnxiensis]|uniref:hypothetical protein n=1 Tax=Paenibacillus jiagnxiensis TaxID=3228926 RepID=UPI0033ABD254